MSIVERTAILTGVILGALTAVFIVPPSWLVDLLG